MGDYEYVVITLSLTLAISVVIIVLERRWKEKWFRRWKEECEHHDVTIFYLEKFFQRIEEHEPDFNKNMYLPEGHRILNMLKNMGDQKTSPDRSGKQ